MIDRMAEMSARRPGQRTAAYTGERGPAPQ